MEKLNNKIQAYAEILRLTHLKKSVGNTIHQAQIDKPSYLEYTLNLLQREVLQRQKTDYLRRLKMANLPQNHDLQNYDFNFVNGITKSELKQLLEFAAGLIYQAIKQGYKAYFITMEDLINVLRLKEMTSSALGKYNRLLKSQLLAIDDIMMFPMKKNEAVAFFNLIDNLHEKSSVVITTNKSPKQWAETLDDEVLASALLDRVLYRCEVVKLSGESYRMENRKTIFDD